MELRGILRKLRERLGGKCGQVSGLLNGKLSWVVMALGVAGILLIYLSSWISPAEEESGPEPTPEPSGAAISISASEYRQRLEQDLCRVVRAVTGEDSPEVMVTLEDEGGYIYAQDSRSSKQTDGQQEGWEQESSHVILESGGSEQGLMLSQRQPEVKGVVIVSLGARDPAVREKLVNAARTALGVSAARVCVVEGR